MKSRRDRRYGMALENPFGFYWRYLASGLRAAASMTWTYWRLRRSLKRIWSDPQRLSYREIAITPPDLDER